MALEIHVLTLDRHSHAVVLNPSPLDNEISNSNDYKNVFIVQIYCH